MYYLLFKSFLETLYLIFFSGVIGLSLGFLLSLFLYLLDMSSNNINKCCYNMVSVVIDTFRAIPFVILVILISPMTRAILGVSIGTRAAIVPLIITILPFSARLFEVNLKAVSQGFKELGDAFGASNFQTLFHIILPQALPQMIASVCLVMINLVSYSTMAGIIGGGGLGDLGIRYGYHRYSLIVMLEVTTLLVFITWIIQKVGLTVSQYYQRLN